jgi:hypothetical protein
MENSREHYSRQWWEQKHKEDMQEAEFPPCWLPSEGPGGLSPGLFDLASDKSSCMQGSASSASSARHRLMDWCRWVCATNSREVGAEEASQTSQVIGWAVGNCALSSQADELMARRPA